MDRQKETDWNWKYGFAWTWVWSLHCVVEGDWVGLERGGWVTVAQISYSGKLKSQICGAIYLDTHSNSIWQNSNFETQGFH